MLLKKNLESVSICPQKYTIQEWWLFFSAQRIGDLTVTSHTNPAQEQVWSAAGREPP